MRQIKKFILALLTLCTNNGIAHPMPNSMVILQIHEKHISGEIQIPLGELQSAIGMGVNDNSEGLIERLGDSLRIYLLKHIRPKTFDGKLWKVELGAMQVNETKSELSGEYKELIIEFSITPPQDYDLRNFYFDYDVVLHQVASHKALIAIKQDWQQGILHEDGTPPDGTPLDSTMQQVGVIEWDIVNNKLNPFQVSLQEGSWWQGFKSMVSLGIKHIAEGTDHLLFLLTLLLAGITSKKKRESSLINLRPIGLNIFKIITAFTIGHSLTLLIGAFKVLSFPSQNIEILIAISILISAVHAFRPIFAGKEMFVAGGFGLIHGLAFADTLINLQLNFQRMALSILGFNIGIELMQLFVMLLIIPFLILLSQTRFYTIFKKTGAIIVGIFSFGWLFERIQQKPNLITIFIETAANNALWLLLALAFSSVTAWFLEKNMKKQ